MALLLFVVIMDVVLNVVVCWLLLCCNSFDCFYFAVVLYGILYLKETTSTSEWPLARMRSNEFDWKSLLLLLLLLVFCCNFRVIHIDCVVICP